MATGDLEHEAARTGARREAFWEVLERVAALGGDGARLRRPVPFEVVAEGAPEADTPRAPKGPVPREVYQQLRSLLSDVDTLGDATVDGPVDPPNAEATSVGAERGPEVRERGSRGEDSRPGVARTLEEVEEPEGTTEETPAPPRPVWLTWQEVPEEPEGATAEAVSPDPVGAQQGSAADAAPPSSEAGAGHGIGAHASVIPGTEEFMALLERKNRAFEETGEIDTDLDRAADRLAWDRTSDDVIAKRRVFRKRKRD
jgi:hypothetical protein